jgi:hypothetical protein
MDDKKLEKEAEDWIFKTQSANCIQNKISYFSFAKQAYIASAKVRENQIEEIKRISKKRKEQAHRWKKEYNHLLRTSGEREEELLFQIEKLKREKNEKE